MATSSTVHDDISDISNAAYETVAILRMAATVCELLGRENDPIDSDVLEGLGFVLGNAADVVYRLKIHLDLPRESERLATEQRAAKRRAK